MKRNRTILPLLLLLPLLAGCSTVSPTAEPAEPEPPAAVIAQKPEIEPTPPEAPAEESPQTPEEAETQEQQARTLDELRQMFPIIRVQVYQTPLDIQLPEPETLCREQYFSQIREELRVDSIDGFTIESGEQLNHDSGRYLWLPNIDDTAWYFVKKEYVEVKEHVEGDEVLYSLWGLREICKLPVRDVIYSGYGQTLRRLYFLADNGRCLTQIDPMTGDVTIAYQTDGVLERLICGQNIVVFTEQTADGSWRVLRLYEPDGTVAVMEENLPSSPRPYMISNCELVVRWESPEYTALIKAHAADYWDNWDGAHPFPGLEESLKTGDFGEHLPEHIYEDYGVFTNVLRYQNTLTGKVVTLNSVPRCFRIPRYFRTDGTEWALSEARSLYENTNYNMVRFWLYLPTDKTG